MDDLARTRDWLVRTAQRRATDVIDIAGGVAVRHREFPRAHDHNRLIITAPVTAAQVEQSADAVLGGAGLGHRLVTVFDADVTEAIAPGLVERGYGRGDELVMIFEDAPPAPPAIEILELDAQERASVATAGWAAEQPDWPPEVSWQLGDRITSVLAAADCTFLAVRSPRGDVLARTDLYIRDGIAQVEEVETHVSARNQGLASALVREAVRLATLDDARLIFLIADADDWPATLYRRLGFEDAGLNGCFTR